jgi:hypothetical protein
MVNPWNTIVVADGFQIAYLYLTNVSKYLKCHAKSKYVKEFKTLIVPVGPLKFKNCF